MPTAYNQSHVAPEARDAARDIRAQRAELHVSAEDLAPGDHVWYRPTGNAFLVTLAARPGDVYVRAVEMLSLGYAPAKDAVWLDITHGYETLSPEEAAAEVAEMEARQDRDADDRADRWGGGWDND